MSIAIDLELKNNIPIGPVLPEVGKALQEILALTYIPVIIAEFSVKNEPLIDSYLIEPSSELIAVKIENEPEIATIITYTMDYPIEESRVAVSFCSYRTPLEVALVAAVAIALGRFLKEDIYDSSLFYQTVLNQSAARLAENLRLEGSFDDYKLAAQELYNKLPKAMPDLKRPERKAE
jgi:hypothetical protein